MDKVFQKALSKAVELIKIFDGLAAIGLTGSYAESIQDEHSDLDICVFVRDRLPLPESREQKYWNFGIEKMIYFDVDLEVSRADGVRIDGINCSLIWMAIPYALKFLRNLRRDFDCDEFLPGGLLKTKPIFDPKGNIDKLISIVPRYPEDRAIHRIRRNVEKAYYIIHGIGWLKAAASRNDFYSFLKYEYEVLDNFMTTLFALNHEWFCDERRLIKIIGNFELTPENCVKRLESIIMHQGDNANLKKCLENIGKLFFDICKISRQRYPHLELPEKWGIESEK